MMLVKDPVPYVDAAPLPSNILEWHYVIQGPEGSPYHNGIYHGKLCFPPDYPYRPPSIYMITPNGRFKTNRRLCLSISIFIPIHGILPGIYLPYLPRILAKKSLEYNLKNKQFCELFPDIAMKIRNELEKRKEIEPNKTLNGGVGSIREIDGQQVQSITSTEKTSSSSINESNNGKNRFLWSVIYNLIIAIILVIFFYIARFVLHGSDIFDSPNNGSTSLPSTTSSSSLS
ncbi:hypothetical protein RDWZM_004678 [Blomia tropicalis]|uniref:UBC core domain-containing protein n=1 Tax=Blomia tropicalis TaxID=40697 RepID=A0A9Q0M3Y4_BLOTA|nr:hypothetical protein RDWZM_004678 [Blomia tropicalis]